VTDDETDGVEEVEGQIAQIRDPLIINPARPLWLLSAILVVALIGVAVFLAVTHLTDNRESIRKNCEQRNGQLLEVNMKFSELSELIDLITSHTNGVLQEPDVAEAIETLRRPIPVLTCKSS
jgi:hypothetical protein